MATRADIEAIYDDMDELFRESFGDHADITCALFAGDFSKTLEQAQRDKHRYILDGLNVGPGSRVLDVGCGWGPLLAAIRERGAHGVGITLSRRQLESCRRGGFETHLMDWRDLGPDTFGALDGIAAVGAMEHFCSPEDYEAGRQDQIYQRFFDLCGRLLPKGGRLYVQSMTWGPHAPALRDVSLQAPRDSNEYTTAMLREFYPGTFGAFGVDHYVRCAAPQFREIARSDGRLDYLETMARWGAWSEMTPRKLWMATKLVWPWVTRPEFRRKVASFRSAANTECFRREILTLSRLLLERT
ncbi:MAG TPA: class I SAM-dependent methyltransferase [Candidatus Binatia bacterium]|jgi:cyclopropane-fatty-acyl-phospholipid synthase